MKPAILIIFFFVARFQTKAQIKLPQIIRDSMILQRDIKINIWGWASKSEKVSVKSNNKTYKPITGNDGKWKVQLSPMKAGGPYTMEIFGKNKIVLHNILIGDVWLCAGQSNMEHQMKLHEVKYANEILNANYAAIRQFKVPNVANLLSPRDDIKGGSWIAPLINYSIKGFLWYQGESNTGNPDEYAKLQPAMINDWRSKWKEGDVPFLFVQLPGFGDYNYLASESQWAAFREAQAKSLSVPNTAMAVAIDIGEWNDVHPDNKKDVGDRLALAAEKIAYDEDIVYSGPTYESSTIEGNKIIISFTNTGSGLTTNDGEAPAEFAIAGADKKFFWANAKIEGDKVAVWSDEISSPQYVRYAWADDPVNPNLINKEGLPAAPFRANE
jgi:hypothetical protein